MLSQRNCRCVSYRSLKLRPLRGGSGLKADPTRLPRSGLVQCKLHRDSGAVALHNRALRIMCEGQQNIQCQAPERRVGVELLRDRDEADAE
jgi:hypothetical protein